MNAEFLLICAALLLIAALYSSVGHGGASGYLAILSLTSFASMQTDWLKQQAWFLNLIVASIAFWHYKKAGFHNSKLTLPLIMASIPAAFLGGYLSVGGAIYDLLLSATLIWAAWRLWKIQQNDEDIEIQIPDSAKMMPIGGGIGFFSGIIGVGGGIFLSPILLLNRWAKPKAVAATAALFIWVNSAAGLAGAAFSGRWLLEVSTLMPFAVVVLFGGFVGSRYGAKFAPEKFIRKLLVFVLIIAASRRLLGLIGI
jgi:uncharacterized membrane protein YfcA